MAASANLRLTTSIYTDFKHGGMLLGTSGSFLSMSWSSGHSLSFFAITLTLTNTDPDGLDHPISIYTRDKTFNQSEQHQYFLNKFWIPHGTAYNVFTRSSPLYIWPGLYGGDFYGLSWDHTTANKIHAHVDFWRTN